MSDGEEDTSFLSLTPTAFPRHCLNSSIEEARAATDSQELLIQVGQSLPPQHQDLICTI